MEKRIYWFLGLLITGMFCVSCSENEDVSVQRRVTEAESSLNLIAPNGVKIISDIAELKKKLSEAVDAIRKRYGRSAITRGVFPEKEEKEDE